MSARAKLEESNFFLKKLRALQTLPQDLDTQNKSHYYLSAFLSAARSVFDHLLEDYNIKFSLNIPLTERKIVKIFKKKAKKTNNKCALSFIEWWEEKQKSLMNDPIGELLINKRNIGIHRMQVKPDLAKIAIIHYLPSPSLKLELFDADGKLEKTYESIKHPPPTQITSDWFFIEYPNEPMMNVCEKFLNMLTTFVSEAEQEFA